MDSNAFQIHGETNLHHMHIVPGLNPDAPRDVLVSLCAGILLRRRTVLSPPSYLQDDAFLAMLEKHWHKAVNCLILHDLSQLDLVLSDASCEQRHSFLLDQYWKV
jgi:hypothetical protein